MHFKYLVPYFRTKHLSKIRFFTFLKFLPKIIIFWWIYLWHLGTNSKFELPDVFWKVTKFSTLPQENLYLIDIKIYIWSENAFKTFKNNWILSYIWSIVISIIILLKKFTVISKFTKIIAMWMGWALFIIIWTLCGAICLFV